MTTTGYSFLRGQNRPPLAWGVCMFLLPLWWSTGCAMITAPPEPVRHTYSTQRNELFKICPEGTSREETQKRLAAAGIEGEFGTNQSIYYCDFWTRDDGEVWEMNLALLFDEEGVLYSTMPGRAQITTGIQ